MAFLRMIIHLAFWLGANALLKGSSQTLILLEYEECISHRWLAMELWNTAMMQMFKILTATVYSGSLCLVIVTLQQCCKRMSSGVECLLLYHHSSLLCIC